MPMSEGTLILLLVLVAGLLGGNDLVGLAAAVLLSLQVAGIPALIQALETHGVRLGVLFLFIGVLLPFATGRLGISTTANSLISPFGGITIIIGAVTAFLAAKGITLLQTQPETMIGLILGSVLGVTLFGGIPAGPLVAAGLAALVLQALR